MRRTLIFLIPALALAIASVGCKDLTNQEAALIMDQNAASLWALGQMRYAKLAGDDPARADAFAGEFVAGMNAANTLKFDLYMGEINGDKQAGQEVFRQLETAGADEPEIILAVNSLRGLFGRVKFGIQATIEQADAVLTRRYYTVAGLKRFRDK